MAECATVHQGRQSSTNPRRGKRSAVPQMCASGPVVGLTGGMGSGKTTVALSLARGTGLLNIDADRVCRELLVPGGRGGLAVREAFGSEYFGADGTVDRRRLRKAIFTDPKIRKRLNEILHPLARTEIEARIRDYRRAGGTETVLVEAPLLFEAGWEKDFDRIVVVYAEPAVCIRRLVQRDKLSPAEAESSLACQMPLFEKAWRADHVVDNSGCWLRTWLQLYRLRMALRFC